MDSTNIRLCRTVAFIIEKKSMYSWMHTWVQTHVVQGSAVFCNVPVRTQTGQQAMLIVTQGIGMGLTGKREREV